MKRPAKRRIKKTNITILLVVEGYTEEAFSKHLRSCYISRETNISLTIKNAKGHGPEGIVDKFKSVLKVTKYYDFKAAFFDSDIPCSVDVNRYFRENEIHCLVSDPCIEALLILILNRRPPDNTRLCKQFLPTLVNGDPLDQIFYERNFSKTLLDQRRAAVVLLHQIISFITRS